MQEPEVTTKEYLPFHIAIGDDGKPFVHRTKPAMTDEQLAELDELRYLYRDECKQRAKSTGYSPMLVAEMFKDSDEAREDVRRLVTEYASELDEIAQKHKAIQHRMKNHPQVSRTHGEVLARLSCSLDASRVEFLEKNLSKLKKIQLFLMPVGGSNLVARLGQQDLERLKEVSIDTFVDFDATEKGLCIWHTEHTPSMKWYPDDNHVHCFGCNESGDVVDVVQAVYDVDFKDALKILSKYVT